MALAAGNEVAYIQPVGNAAYSERNGEFQFGVVNVAGGTVDVLWANGTIAEGVVPAYLDLITPDSSSSVAEGKVVSIDGNTSPEYYGIVIRVYFRDPNGGGSPISYTLIQLLSTGRLIEVPTANVTVATGRCSSLDTATLHAIAESAQSAALRSGLGDREGATAALERAERRLAELSATLPAHSRIVRLGREAVARARAAVELTGAETATRREERALVRATERAVRRAKS